MIAIMQQALPAEPAIDAVSAEERFASLVSRQSRFVFRIAYAVLRNVQDAEDVTQETFLRVYRRRAWNAIEDERAFLARVAWRIAVDRARRRTPPEMQTDPACPGDNPEQAAIARDWNAVVRQLIDVLPEELRLPLSLSSVEEWNSREIGRAMGIPEGTVRTRLFRARQILKRKLTALMETSHGQR